MSSGKNISRLLLMLGLTAFGSAAWAQVVELDLPRAVERAFNVDPRIAEKEQLIKVAEGLRDEAEGINSWIVDLNAFVGIAPDVRGGFFENENGEITTPKNAFQTNGISPWYNLEVKLIRPMYTFGKSESYTNAARYNIIVKQGDVRVQRAGTYLDVVRAYNGYLAAQESRILLEDANKRVEAAIDMVQGWLDDGEGKATQSSLYALQTGSGLIKRYAAQASALEQIAMAGLKLLTGVKSSDQIQLLDKRIQPLPLPEEELAALQEHALMIRPEMEQVAAGLNARRELMFAKRAEAFPNIYAGVAAEVAYSPSRPRLDDVALIDPFNHAGATPVVGVKWDWWLGRQRGAVTQAEAEYNALIEKKSFAQQGIPFQVAEEYYQVQAHRKMVDELREAAQAGRRWMISSFADFEAGVETADKVVAAFQGYILAYGDYLKVVNDYNLHIAQLRVATGEIQ